MRVFVVAIFLLLLLYALFMPILDRLMNMYWDWIDRIWPNE